MVGKRRNPGLEPHNVPYVVLGAGLLWFGWFGFNAGSAAAANASAGMAMTVTHISASMGALTWMILEWSKISKPSVLGIATGSIAGLAAITPAAGYVGPFGAIVIGLLSGSLCFWGANGLKRRFGYDDSLDVFGVHGIGGAIGTIMTAFLASTAWGGFETDLNIGSLLRIQAFGVALTAVYSGILTFLIVKLVDSTLGILYLIHI